MQTIRGIFLIVPSIIISIFSLIQERIDINQPILIVDEIAFNSYTLNSFSQCDSSAGLASNRSNANNDKTSLEVKTIRSFLMITDADDLLIKSYLLSALYIK